MIVTLLLSVLLSCTFPSVVFINIKLIVSDFWWLSSTYVYFTTFQICRATGCHPKCCIHEEIMLHWIYWGFHQLFRFFQQPSPEREQFFVDKFAQVCWLCFQNKQLFSTLQACERTFVMKMLQGCNWVLLETITPSFDYWL